LNAAIKHPATPPPLPSFLPVRATRSIAYAQKKSKQKQEILDSIRQKQHNNNNNNSNIKNDTNPFMLPSENISPYKSNIYTSTGEMKRTIVLPYSDRDACREMRHSCRRHCLNTMFVWAKANNTQYMQQKQQQQHQHFNSKINNSASPLELIHSVSPPIQDNISTVHSSSNAAEYSVSSNLDNDNDPDELLNDVNDDAADTIQDETPIDDEIEFDDEEDERELNTIAMQQQQQQHTKHSKKQKQNNNRNQKYNTNYHQNENQQHARKYTSQHTQRQQQQYNESMSKQTSTNTFVANRHIAPNIQLSQEDAELFAQRTNHFNPKYHNNYIVNQLQQQSYNTQQYCIQHLEIHTSSQLTFCHPSKRALLRKKANHALKWIIRDCCDPHAQVEVLICCC
jgi:hypothetical protein